MSDFFGSTILAYVIWGIAVLWVVLLVWLWIKRIVEERNQLREDNKRLEKEAEKNTQEHERLRSEIDALKQQLATLRPSRASVRFTGGSGGSVRGLRSRGYEEGLVSEEHENLQAEDLDIEAERSDRDEADEGVIHKAASNNDRRRQKDAEAIRDSLKKAREREGDVSEQDEKER